MTHSDSGTPTADGGPLVDETSAPVIIATNFREVGSTGVHTHFQQVRRYLEQCGTAVTVVTPFSWGRTLTYPVFAPRLVLKLFNKPASVVWYRKWHEVFLHNALRRYRAGVGDCVGYAQTTPEARAGLRARRGH